MLLLALAVVGAAQVPPPHGAPPPDDGPRAPLGVAGGRPSPADRRPPPPRDAARPERPPREPLRQLVLASPVVLLADVERSSQQAFDDGAADLVLRPSRVLRGQVPTVLLNARTSQRSTRPAAGESGVFFLSPAEQERSDAPLVLDAWVPASGRTLAVFEHSLVELLDILDERAASRREARTTEWLVQLVEEPDTRWDGLLDLSSASDPRAAGRRAGRPQFDAGQRARLLAVLLAERDLTSTGTTLAALLPQGGDPHVERWLWDRLNESRELPMPVTGEAMHLLARRLDDRTAERLADDLPAGGPQEQRKDVVARFLERLEPRVFPDEPRRDG